MRSSVPSSKKRRPLGCGCGTSSRRCIRPGARSPFGRGPRLACGGAHAVTPERILAQLFATLDRVAVAVSGGVDSMTLAHLVHRHHGARAQMVHAVSPAVPAEATARVRAHAERHGWALALIDAGEFADTRYRANPVDRC